MNNSPRGPITGAPVTSGGGGEDNDPPAGGSASGGTGGASTPPPAALGGGGSVGMVGTGALPGGAFPGGSTGGGTGGLLGGLAGGGTTTGGTVGGMGILGGLLGGTAGGGGAGGAAPVGDASAPSATDAGATLDGGAGVDGGPDAGPDDAAVGDAGFCPTESSARVDGGCQGSYCSMTLDALGPFTQSGACSDQATLRLVCEAQLARKTAQCAQDNALSLALGSAVRSCLRGDAQLAAVSAGCVDCYVSELLCTLSSCLATCVAGFDLQCTSCRRESCGAEFTRCSGLPAL